MVELGGERIEPVDAPLDELRAIRDASEIYALESRRAMRRSRQLIDAAGKDGDTLGGIVEVRVDGLPFGLGTHAQWDRKLDGRLAQAVMAVQAIKGVEIGLGFEAARRRGSQVHDPIHFDESQRDTPKLGYVRPTNNAGGLEGGMTNGQPLVVRAAKKPISTLAQAAGVDQSGDEGQAGSELRAERRVRGAGGERDRGERGGVRGGLCAGGQVWRRQPAGDEGAVRAVSGDGAGEVVSVGRKRSRSSACAAFDREDFDGFVEACEFGACRRCRVWKRFERRDAVVRVTRIGTPNSLVAFSRRLVRWTLVPRGPYFALAAAGVADLHHAGVDADAEVQSVPSTPAQSAATSGSVSTIRSAARQASSAWSAWSAGAFHIAARPSP